MLNELNQLHSSVDDSLPMEATEDIAVDDQSLLDTPDDTDVSAPLLSEDASITPNSQPRYLSYIHPEHVLYLPLAYPLFYPTGGEGYHRHMTLSGTTLDGTPRRRDNITPLMYYRWLLFTRSDTVDFNTLHRGGLLFQQWVVDAWLTDETHKMEYYRFNQKKIRADLYSHLLQAMAEGVEPDQTGRRFILPADVKGSPRYMHQRYLDSMAVVRVFGNPDLFPTFTCNPYWEEITNELLRDRHGALIQTWKDRPDLVARVFRLKLRAFIDELTGLTGVLGPAIAFVYAIEYQKRGMPHAHILIWLKDEYSLDTPSRVDEVICAELPDLSNPGDNTPENQKLLEIVKTNLMHKPCGEFNPDAPCMVQKGLRKICSRGFPKKFTNDTVITDGYPLYRRRDSVRVDIPHPSRKGESLSMGNEWVVPYNPYLALRYKAHINVEVATTLFSVKYLHKYLQKGSDRATAEFEADEIKQYINGRYIGSAEACWRLFEFPVGDISPSVTALVVHLPNEVRLNPYCIYLLLISV